MLWFVVSIHSLMNCATESKCSDVVTITICKMAGTGVKIYTQVLQQHIFILLFFLVCGDNTQCAYFT